MPDLLAAHGAWAVEEVVRRGGPLETRARGLSMMPLVWPGARLPLRPADESGVRVGDVVVIARGGRLVAHRAIFRAPDGAWRTRGDASEELDASEEGERVVARVEGFALGLGVLRLPEPVDAGLRRLVLRVGPSLARLYRHASPTLRFAVRSGRRAYELVRARGSAPLPSAGRRSA